ncbi:hypothetical protein [Streptomyces sp. NPDC012888]|uniref:hypothetical protein n=1 Tax=Streptomyces sp. NPDC012888 TaxID=3364855 RepID=UPI003692153D
MGFASKGRRARFAGGVALPLVFALAGFTAPAAASDHEPVDTRCDTKAVKPVNGAPKTVQPAKPGKPVKPVKAAGPAAKVAQPAPPKKCREASPAVVCRDIDSTLLAVVEYSAVLSGRNIYVGRRLTPATPYEWRLLSGVQNPGFPRKHACGVSIVATADTLYVKVLTKKGDVYENRCVTATLICPTGWTALVRPA